MFNLDRATASSCSTCLAPRSKLDTYCGQQLGIEQGAVSAAAGATRCVNALPKGEAKKMTQCSTRLPDQAPGLALVPERRGGAPIPPLAARDAHDTGVPSMRMAFRGQRTDNRSGPWPPAQWRESGADGAIVTRAIIAEARRWGAIGVFRLASLSLRSAMMLHRQHKVSHNCLRTVLSGTRSLERLGKALALGHRRKPPKVGQDS
jgi:hypothetical protein